MDVIRIWFVLGYVILPIIAEDFDITPPHDVMALSGTTLRLYWTFEHNTDEQLIVDFTLIDEQGIQVFNIGCRNRTDIGVFCTEEKGLLFIMIPEVKLTHQGRYILAVTNGVTDRHSFNVHVIALGSSLKDQHGINIISRSDETGDLMGNELYNVVRQPEQTVLAHVGYIYRLHSLHDIPYNISCSMYFNDKRDYYVLRWNAVDMRYRFHAWDHFINEDAYIECQLNVQDHNSPLIILQKLVTVTGNSESYCTCRMHHIFHHIFDSVLFICIVYVLYKLRVIWTKVRKDK